MAHEILRDSRIRSIIWKDLVDVSALEIAGELAIPVPWLIASFVFAAQEWFVPALIASFMFFLAGLRLVHNAYHYSLGLPRPACEWVMFGLSVAMLGSMHAVQFHHLRHHKHCLDDEDVEAMSALLPWYGALLAGPWFPILLHWKALSMASWRRRILIIGELVANLIWIAVVFCYLDVAYLRYHVCVMALGQCLTAFFAVWTVHHECDRTHYIARTLRRNWLNILSLNMFFHVEHHLFPKVPTCHLKTLARRLDFAAPELRNQRVI